MKQSLSLPELIGQSIKYRARKIFGSSPKMTHNTSLKMTHNTSLKITILLLSLTIVSCKGKNTTDNSGLQAATAAKSSVVESPTGGIETTTRDLSKIDLDLTKMSATMIYSTIFDMLVMAEDYIDKNIKVTGWFETYTDPETSELYYAVVVPDATACCQQGLEFVWPGNHTYPDDFPKTGEDITITGLYKLIETDGVTYTYLEASKVEF